MSLELQTDQLRHDTVTLLSLLLFSARGRST